MMENQEKVSSLIQAVDGGNSNRVFTCLWQGANPNQIDMDDRGRTLLMKAVGAGNKEMAQLLLDKGHTLKKQMRMAELH